MPSELTVRANAVKAQIDALRKDIVNHALDLGELLSEVKANNYHEVYGYGRFVDWLDRSGLDMSERTAYYLVKIVDTARSMGISRQQLEAVKMSKLKEIFTLDPEKNADDIKRLVGEGDGHTLDEVRDEESRIKAAGEQVERLVWRNFRLLESQKAVVDQAIERAKRECGDTINPETGEVCDPSDARALELIAAEYIAQPDMMVIEAEQLPEEA